MSSDYVYFALHEYHRRSYRKSDAIVRVIESADKSRERRTRSIADEPTLQWLILQLPNDRSAGVCVAPQLHVFKCGRRVLLNAAREYELIAPRRRRMCVTSDN